VLCFFSFFPREETRPRGVAGFDIAVLSDTAPACFETGRTDPRGKIEWTFAPSFGAVDKYLNNTIVAVPLVALSFPVQVHRRLTAAGILNEDTIP
jgi:hypothetical protein